MSSINLQAETKKEVDKLSASVIRVLLYYDLFNYPLTIEEVLRHCDRRHCTLEEVKESLETLLERGLVFSRDNLYSLQSDPTLFTRRINGNREAEKAMKKARRRSAFIARFPFVRCVCISGSLSKHYFDETTDIDFFVVTKPEYLWLCRSLLILYKKIFLLNSKKYFCINYFIDSENLEIPDKNIFTATEVTTLLPVYNSAIYEKFFSANQWVKEFYPNSSPRKNPFALSENSFILKTVLEKILGGRLGSWLDNYFHRVTLKHWKTKFSQLNKEEFEVNMRSNKNVSKHHPQGFQFRILKLFDDHRKAFEERHQVSLL